MIDTIMTTDATDTTKIIQKVAAIKSTRNTDRVKRSVTIMARTSIGVIIIRVNIGSVRVIGEDKFVFKDVTKKKP